MVLKGSVLGNQLKVVRAAFVKVFTVTTKERVLATFATVGDVQGQGNSFKVLVC